jgi:hypothetical protein
LYGHASLHPAAGGCGDGDGDGAGPGDGAGTGDGEGDGDGLGDGLGEGDGLPLPALMCSDIAINIASCSSPDGAISLAGAANPYAPRSRASVPYACLMPAVAYAQSLESPLVG